MKEKLKTIRELLKKTKFKMVIGVMILGIIFSLFFDFSYFIVIVIIGVMYYLIKQAEKDNDHIMERINREDMEYEIEIEIEELEKRISVVQEHISTNDDLDAKLKLMEMEEKLKKLKKMIDF